MKDFTTEAAPNIARNASSTIDDDIDDFIPYQGERFNAFDWNIFKVIIFHFNYILHSYRQINLSKLYHKNIYLKYSSSE